MKEPRPAFVIETERIYKSFEKDISELRSTEPSKNTDIKLDQIIVSSYVKTYDFILFLCNINDHQNSFFLLPFLRGICEDLIVLTYIIQQPKERQNYIIVKKRYQELNKSTTAQNNFFHNYNSGQIVPPIYNEGVSIEEIIQLHRDAGHKLEEVNLPNVYQMAEKVNLKYLYDFIYHSTSKAVHFDIFTLLSMGWGEIDVKNETIKATFSHKNDYKHYFKFALFYSSYLFIKQSQNFKETLNLPNLIIESIEELEIQYKKNDWPFLVTFGHLNIKEPSELIKNMFRNMNIKND
ncbi:DUF5677 domain-containing protein [Sphingobacterium hungaricum]|uniref:Uncharacterized protein n=1 Tax=Sphingobacterium hungaricum TaxID=2082723 RepID=A0A928V2P8_9SPHI|nr:DUF5677 domain-containing protein [Sphingobacterium hungaricum]MBE8715539.1 hypothetical protein [Sphingobacterium hungaricum]